VIEFASLAIGVNPKFPIFQAIHILVVTAALLPNCLAKNGTSVNVVYLNDFVDIKIGQVDRSVIQAKLLAVAINDINFRLTGQNF
jgi:hypothetical protein